MTIVPVAIGRGAGIAELRIPASQDHATLSTDVDLSPQGGGKVTTLEVRTVRFRDILAEYGTPFYLKIDIEHFDHYCLEDLEPGDLPPYTSFEAHKLEDILTARDKGYDDFKLIKQYTFQQLHFDPNDVKSAVKRRLAGRPGLVRALGLPGCCTIGRVD